MKKILIVFCLFLTIYALTFPFTYFKSNDDKKEVRVSHILVETNEKAQKIKQELENGKKFEDLAKKYSTDEQSKNSKGDIGYAQRGRFHKNINSAIFKLPEGKLSDPVESDDGWHIIKVNEIKYYSESENFKYDKYKYLDL